MNANSAALRTVNRQMDRAQRAAAAMQLAWQALLARAARSSRMARQSSLFRDALHTA
jgi:hypothetical protein